MNSKYETVADAVEAIRGEYSCAEVFLKEDGEAAIIDLGDATLYVRWDGIVLRNGGSWFQ